MIIAQSPYFCYKYKHPKTVGSKVRPTEEKLLSFPRFVEDFFMTEEKKGAKKLSPRKADAITKLTDKVGRAKAIFLTDYRGLTHQQLETLKRALKKVEGEFVVAKNTLLRISMKKLDADTTKQFGEHLKNPTATFFSYGDEIAAIKALATFIKTTQLPKIKIGLFGGKIATESDFQKLSSLPTREVLLATLVNRLQGPIYGLHHALNWNLQRLVTVLSNVKDKKPAN